MFDLEEVEAAFRNYWQLGAAGEDWDTWCDQCFTAVVTYVEHILGNKVGREAVRAWIKPAEGRSITRRPRASGSGSE